MSNQSPAFTENATAAASSELFYDTNASHPPLPLDFFHPATPGTEIQEPGVKKPINHFDNSLKTDVACAWVSSIRTAGPMHGWA